MLTTSTPGILLGTRRKDTNKNGGTQKVGREQISRELRLRPRAEDRAVGIFRSDVKETENRSDAHLPLKREHWTVQRDVLLRANLCQGLV